MARADEHVNDFEKAVEVLRKDLSKMIYKGLEKEHDWLTDDEQLIEASESMDYVFDECGECPSHLYCPAALTQRQSREDHADFASLVPTI